MKINNVLFKGINTTEILSSAIVEIAKKYDFKLKLEIAMDIMKLTKLNNYHSSHNYKIADQSYKNQLLTIAKKLL